MYQYWFTNSDKYTGQMLDVNNRGNNNTPKKRSLGLCLSLSHPFHLSLPPSLSQTTLSCSRGRKPPCCKQLYKDTHLTRKWSLSSSGPQELRSASKHERMWKHLLQPQCALPSWWTSPTSWPKSPKKPWIRITPPQAPPRIRPAETARSTARSWF